RPAVDDASHGDYRDVGGATTDVHHHVSGGLCHGQTGTHRCHHGLFHEIDLRGLGAIGRILHGPFFHLGDFRRNADDDAGAHPQGAVVRLLDEMVQHFFGVFEIGDDTVLHGTDGDDVAGSATQHLLGFLAHRLHLASLLVHGDDRRLANHDSLSFGVNQSIGGP